MFHQTSFHNSKNRNRHTLFRFINRSKFKIDLLLITKLLKPKFFKEVIKINAESSHACPIYLQSNKSLNEQAFHLSIQPEQVTIEASSKVGFFYGICEWADLIAQFYQKLPCHSMKDEPKLLKRGYMIDISRCKVPKLSEIKNTIDHLAILRYNHLQLYIEHTYAFCHHKQVWGDSSPLTASEITELDQYCSERFIELVPNLNSFGHFERWLKHSDYQHLAESPKGFTSPFGDFRPVGSVLKPNQKSLNFIDSLYREYLPNFKSKTFNVGCDETFELGQGYSKTKVAKYGVHKVYFDHLLKINKLVKKHRRKMMFWADILIESPEVIKNLPKDITALIWGYEADHPYRKQCKTLQSTQADYWVCPGSSSWNSILGRWDNAEENILSAYQNGVKYGAKGILLTDWGDGGHHQFNPISYPSLIYTAYLSWNGQAPSKAKLKRCINDVFFDPEHQLGQPLLEMGKVYKRLNSPIMNGNAFHHLLFGTNKTKTPSMKRLAQTKEAILSIRQAMPNSDLLDVREMHLGIDMAILALQKTLHQAYQEPFPLSDARRLIGTYEELWLERNRVGGLYESSSLLRKALILD